MQLRYSPASPFVRKVVIAAHLLGLQDRIDLVPADTLNPADPLRQQNPLGKIPALVLDDGKVLYNSRVIVEYLDHIGGGGVMPEGSERSDGLCLHALADGIMEGALLQVYETRFARRTGASRAGFRTRPRRLNGRSLCSRPRRLSSAASPMPVISGWPARSATWT